MALTIRIKGKRIMVDYPVPLDSFGNGPLLSAVATVCGEDAIADGMISQAIGAMAFCSIADSKVWRKELGIGDTEKEE